MNDSSPTQIRLSGLTKTYREGQRLHRVLEAVNLEIPRGATVAIRGRSGSGKSTLLNLIGGIDSPDAGSIEVDGSDITLLPEHARTLFRRRQVGFVYQAFNLLPTLTVGENICLVLELNRVTGEAADQRVDALLDAVGLLDRKTALPDILSGGEQQRVAIARALAHQPSVVLADEPTGNLDDEAAAGVLDLLDRLVRKSGGTMLIATHSQRVADFCDYTLFLAGGRIEAEY
jgi:putative ABC transport system ATP-binding protein